MDSTIIKTNSPSVLPEGYHCAVTWGIPAQYGGMTDALLHRSKAFAAEAAVDVDVLTFEWSDDYSEIACELSASGALVPGVHLRNMWEELGLLTETELPIQAMGADADIAGALEFIDLAGSVEPLDTAGSTLRRRIRYASDGKTVLEVDYFRPDGSLVVIDRRDVERGGDTTGRLVVLCGRSGRAVGAWRQIWPLYLFWLDHVVAGRETYMIVDSKITANFVTRYRRDNVITMHLVHSSHLAHGAMPPFGELSPNRKYVFDRLNTYDAVVFLTASQQRDVETLLGPQPNTVVIPNSRHLPNVIHPEAGHTTGTGVVLGRLVPGKRWDHAMRAIALANKSGDLDYHLDIYGHGPSEPSLRAFIDSNGLENSVSLRGYSIDARKEFDRASFTLLTSKLEGQGLVLVEAMSVGCIPISYDISYGPADIIEDGVSGFLVPPGDTAAMAERIVHLSAMDSVAVEGMRRAAVARAKAFDDASVVKLWGDAMRAAVNRKLDKLAARVSG
jgi:poly(glycerol-phosphate) alpha-glucosyltransferase